MQAAHGSADAGRTSYVHGVSGEFRRREEREAVTDIDAATGERIARASLNMLAILAATGFNNADDDETIESCRVILAEAATEDESTMKAMLTIVAKLVKFNSDLRGLKDFQWDTKDCIEREALAYGEEARKYLVAVVKQHVNIPSKEARAKIRAAVSRGIPK